MIKDKDKAEIPSVGLSPVGIEIKKGERGAVISVGGVISVLELSKERISFASHRGKINVLGTSLTLGIYEERRAEVIGRITGVELLYGRA